MSNILALAAVAAFAFGLSHVHPSQPPGPQSGITAPVTIPAYGHAAGTVTFAHAYPDAPAVLATLDTSGATESSLIVSVRDRTPAGFTWSIHNPGAGPQSARVEWEAP